MRTRTVALFFAALLVVATAAEAQGGGSGGGMGGGGMGGGGMGGGGMGRPMGPPRGEHPDPLLLEGPPAPKEMGTIVTLDTTQRARYATLYENFMKDTKADREELRNLHQQMREAMENQDRSSGMRFMETTRELTDRLHTGQEAFDKSLKSLLSKEQWKTYDKWRKDTRKKMEDAHGPQRGHP